MIIKDSTFVNISSNDTTSGKIVWDGDILIFKYDIEPSEYTDVAKLLHKSFGDYCMDIERIRKKKYKYTFRQLDNLHIIIDEGTLTEIKK